MYEGMPNYANSATAGINGGVGCKTNPDYGSFLRPKSYLETRNPKLYALEKKVKEVFADYEDGKFGYDKDCAKKAVDALFYIVANAKSSEDWSESPQSWTD